THLPLFAVHPTTQIYTLSLHDALPISRSTLGFGTSGPRRTRPRCCTASSRIGTVASPSDSTPTTPHAKSRRCSRPPSKPQRSPLDRKSTRLNSSHVKISYAVFCLKKKK